MEQLQFLFFKYRQVIVNAALLCAIIVAILGKTDGIRSLSLGFASGIVIIELGESINRLKSRDAKKVSQE